MEIKKIKLRLKRKMVVDERLANISPPTEPPQVIKKRLSLGECAAKLLQNRSEPIKIKGHNSFNYI